MKKVFLLMLLLGTAAHAKDLSLDTPCDLSVENIGAYFSGHGADSIMSVLKGVSTKKDEYESLGEFYNRLNDSLTKMPKALTNQSLCVVDKNLGLSNSEYDAEAETLFVHIFLLRPRTWFDGKDLHSDFQIFVSERNRKESSYVGANAFGASAKISKIERSATYVSFDSKETSSSLNSAGATSKGGIHIAMPLKMTPSQAKSMHGNIRVAYLYSLRPPLVAHYESYELPKLDWPFESEERQQLLLAKLKTVAIFNVKTGEVIRAFDLI